MSTFTAAMEAFLDAGADLKNHVLVNSDRSQSDNLVPCTLLDGAEINETFLGVGHVTSVDIYFRMSPLSFLRLKYSVEWWFAEIETLLLQQTRRPAKTNNVVSFWIINLEKRCSHKEEGLDILIRHAMNALWLTATRMEIGIPRRIRLQKRKSLSSSFKCVDGPLNRLLQGHKKSSRLKNMRGTIPPQCHCTRTR